MQSAVDFQLSHMSESGVIKNIEGGLFCVEFEMYYVTLNKAVNPTKIILSENQIITVRDS